MVESLVAGRLVRLLQERKIKVERHFERLTGPVKGEDGVIRQKEFDLVADNGEEAVVVEVKTSLNIRKVDEFLEYLKDFKLCMPSYKDKTIYAAVAYLACEPKTEAYAESKGLFVIKATGDSASIVNKESFKPKAFLP